MALSFPFATIDFEASSLASNSWPIELGIAIARGADRPVETWSALIRPHPDWPMSAWDRKSEAVHGIGAAELAAGMGPADVLTELNTRLAPLDHVWCDGGPYDRHWFDRLCRAAPLMRPHFQVWDLSGLFVLDRRAHNRFAHAIAASEPPHRAGPDAERVCAALLISSGVDRDD